MDNNFPSNSMLVRLKLSCAQGTAMERRLRDETVTRRNTQHGTWDKGNAKDQKVQMIGRWLFQVEFGALRENRTHVMIDDKEQEKHESRDNGTDNTFGIDTRERIREPRTVHARFPVPRDGVEDDAVQFSLSVFTLQVNTGQETNSRCDGRCNHSIVSRQKDTDFPGKGCPRFGKMQRPGNEKGQETQHEAGVLRGTVLAFSFLSKVNRFNQIAK
mmetsp:Transcript_6175/g.12372  ORF Transcript_6175/g.12372 Transcript_6175/m.12372 type:complete len:215 (+) Transcript_6175:844-1488(+)